MLPHEKEHERVAFAQMTFREKCVHIATYYWIPIVGVIAGIVIIVLLLNQYVFNPPKDPSISIGLISDEYIDTAATGILDELNEQFPELTTDREEIQTTYFSMLEDEDMNYYYSSQQLIALVAAGGLDVLIGTEGYMKTLAREDYFYRLEDSLSEETLEEWNAIYLNVNSESDALGRVISVEGPYALLVPLPNIGSLTEIFGEDANLYAGVLINSPHLEADWKVIEYLLDVCS